MTTFRILVVDDSLLARRTTVEFLEEQGYVVLEASDAIQALQLIREGSFDLVVMDIQMPGMDGVEATKQAHELQPALPVFAFTGSPELLRGTHDLFHGVFAKPMSLHQLIKSVGHLAASHDRLH